MLIQSNYDNAATELRHCVAGVKPLTQRYSNPMRYIEAEYRLPGLSGCPRSNTDERYKLVVVERYPGTIVH